MVSPTLACPNLATQLRVAEIEGRVRGAVLAIGRSNPTWSTWSYLRVVPRLRNIEESLFMDPHDEVVTWDASPSTPDDRFTAITRARFVMEDPPLTALDP